MNNVWTLDALVAIRELADTKETFTSDDLYLKVSAPPHHNMVGDAFREAHRLGIIEMTGDSTQSTRRAAKGRRIQCWRKVGSSARHTEAQGALL